MPKLGQFVPPGGFAGFAQQSPAVQALLQKTGVARKPRRKTTRKKATRKKATRRAPARRRSTARAKKPARMVKGSAAAKRHMAKLRRMRGKKR